MLQSISAFLKSLCNHRVGIQDLPLEILSSIVSYLSFLDIISLRQTNRRLRDATEVRSLWIALATEYCMRQLIYPRPPTGAFGTEELRKWVTERNIVNEIWKKPVAHPRSVKLSQSYKYSAVAIVPGGRWALLGNSYGYIHAYDLCSKRPKPITLIKPQRTGRAVKCITISVDSQSPILQFTIAFTANDMYFSYRLHIWQVQLGPDGILSAQNLLSTSCSGDLGFTLSDHLVACTSNSLNSSSTWAEVFSWKECSEKRITKSIRMKCRPEFIQIIRNDRLLCVDPCKGIYIYAIPGRGKVQDGRGPSYHRSTSVRGHTWFHPLEGGCHWGYSRLYFDGLYYRLVISTSHSILGLVVPASKKKLPHLVKLADQPPEVPIFHGLGLHKGYAALGGGGVRYGYSWGKGFPAGPFYRNANGENFEGDNRWLHAAFDEETGRSVGISSKHVTLVDFSPDPAFI